MGTVELDLTGQRDSVESGEGGPGRGTRAKGTEQTAPWSSGPPSKCSPTCPVMLPLWEMIFYSPMGSLAHLAEASGPSPVEEREQGP